MLTFCFFAFCAPGRHSGRRNRMAQLGERRAECRGRCSHRPAAYGNVPGRDKAAKAPPASFHSATSPLCEEAFSRAQPAQKGSPQRGELAEPARPEGLCRLAVASPHKKAPPFSPRAALPYSKPFSTKTQKSPATLRRKLPSSQRRQGWAAAIAGPDRGDPPGRRASPFCHALPGPFLPRHPLSPAGRTPAKARKAA